MSIPTFVVGTGRCGSTMLSNMLREHPKVLSLSEFFAWLVDFGSRFTDTFGQRQLDGRTFWELIAGINTILRFSNRHRVTCDEQLYPYDAPEARFTAETGVPAILATTLPHLTDEYEALFDQLEAEVSTWPTGATREQYERLFDWLVVHFGKWMWIERSGAAMHMLKHTLALFPEARIIHVTRDGRDVAISMQGHLGIRLYFVMNAIESHLGVNPLTSSDRRHASRVPEDLRQFMPEHFDAKAFRDLRMPLPVCATFWNEQIETGLKQLASFPPDRLLTLRYEDVLREPRPHLDRLAAFLGDEFIDEDWSTLMAATVRKPHSTWRDLAEDEARSLAEACRPGFEHLRAAGTSYDF